MNQLALPLARRTDPDTSRRAADRAFGFQARQEAKIYAALRSGPMTAKEIAAATGLDYVAVSRRDKGMERKGLIRMGPDERGGCRIWRSAR